MSGLPRAGHGPSAPPSARSITARLLGDVLAQLRERVDGGDALDCAIVAAVEGAGLIAEAAAAAEHDARDQRPVDLAREALGAIRASVVAATVSVRTLEDQRRSPGARRSAAGRLAATS